MFAKPCLTRTPEYVRQARYPLTNSYLTRQSTENCGRVGKCTDKWPFQRWQGATKHIMVNPLQLTQDSTNCYFIYTQTHTHTDFACLETSTSIYDSQTTDKLILLMLHRVALNNQLRRIISDYITVIEQTQFEMYEHIHKTVAVTKQACPAFFHVMPVNSGKIWSACGATLNSGVLKVQ